MLQCQVFKEVLQKYAEATGQVINLNKSSLTFGKKVDQNLKLSIQNSLGIFAEGGAGTYLGLPECFSGSKVEMLAYIQEKMKGRMSGWYTRFLSQAGKEVILKSVAMAMPIYAMSCFKLPKTTCNNLTSAMAAFWWRSTEDKGKIHWLSWDKLCVPKRLGGMGFKDIETFNQAMLAKQAWRILHEQSSLFGTFLKSRYFPNGDFLSAKLGKRPSYAWRSILHGRDLLIKGLRHMVGNGESIHVWSTPWLADGDRMRMPLMKNSLVDLNLKVKDLLIPNSHLWNIPKLNDLFYPQDIAIISKIKPVINSEDFYCWNHTRSGEYSVRSGYWFAEKSANKEAYATATVLPSLNGIKDYIWSLDTAPKIKMFLWKAVSGALPVTDNLLSRGMKIDSRCQVCGMEGESINHVLFTCTLARQFWAICNFPRPHSDFSVSSIYSNIFYVLKAKDIPSIPLNISRAGPWIIWNIWKNRNSHFFEGCVTKAPDFLEKVYEEANHWFLIKTIEKEEKAIDLDRKKKIMFGWKPPPSGWIKCDIGSAWSSSKNESGASWVLRDSDGNVLLHSRRSFSAIYSRMDASMESWLWAIDSLKNLHFDSIIFASDDKDLVAAVTKPSAWPSLKFYSQKICIQLHNFLFWRVQSLKRSDIRGASLIVDSVIKEDRYQSYIAAGYPGWLRHLFVLS